MTPPLPVVFSEYSRTRLHDIQGYIAFHNIRAAARVVDRIIYAAEMLGDHPLLGVAWKGGDTRALKVPGLPYRVHYRVLAGQVEVITVAHTRQLPPGWVGSIED
jgi:plasmid stabilization system protein ParE